MSVKLNLSYPAAKPAEPGTQMTVETEKATTPDAAAKEGNKTDRDALNHAVKQISEFVLSAKRNLEFSIDDASGKVVVKVVDSENGDVIRQLPSEAALKLAQSLNDANSLLFSERV
ncbi:flagellar protein FlaG [compost metagenome]